MAIATQLRDSSAEQTTFVRALSPAFSATAARHAASVCHAMHLGSNVTLHRYPPMLSRVTPIPCPLFVFCRRGMTSSTVSDSALNSSDVVLAPSAEDGASADAASDGRAVPADTVPADTVPAASAHSASSLGSPTQLTSRTTRAMSILALSLGIASFFFAQSVVVPLAAIFLGVFGLRCNVRLGSRGGCWRVDFAPVYLLRRLLESTEQSNNPVSACRFSRVRAGTSRTWEN
jgi:hypothetical protein